MSGGCALLRQRQLNRQNKIVVDGIDCLSDLHGLNMCCVSEQGARLREAQQLSVSTSMVHFCHLSFKQCAGPLSCAQLSEPETQTRSKG
jgi:hypothetical protein